MGLLDNAKEALAMVDRIRHATEEMKSTKLQLDIADLIKQLASLRIEGAELLEQNAKLRSQLTDREDMKALRAKLEFRDNYYYLKEPVAGYDNGPYCVACFAARGKLVHTGPDHYVCVDCYAKLLHGRGNGAA